MIADLVRIAAAQRARVSSIPARLLGTAGLVVPSMRELAEMSYQFTAPFEMGSRRSEERLCFGPTPFDEAATATTDWWRTPA